MAVWWRSRRQLRGIFMLAAVFWINLFIFGLFRSGGVIYVALVETFGSSHEIAAWPISLAGATLCMIGPVASGLIRVLSIRVIVTIGVFVTFLSASLCYLAEDVITILILIGILYGAGVGLTCTLTPLFVTNHFKQHQAIACGLAYSGSTVGSFFWPPLLEYLIDEYGLRGCLLIYGALMLHGILGSIVLQAAPEQQEPDGDSPENYHEREKLNDKRVTREPRVRSSVGECENVSGISVSGLYMMCSESDLRQSRNGSLSHDPRVRRGSCSVEEYSLMSTRHGPASEHVTEEISKTSMCCSQVSRVILNNWAILGNRYFILVTISAVSYFFVFATFIIVIPDYATDNGIPRQDAVFLLSVFGMADLISKPVPGLLTYKGIMTNKNVFISGGYLTGLLMFIMPHLRSHASFVVLTFLYGLVAGGLIFMSPVLLTEFLGMQVATVAFGMSNFLLGASSLFRPLIIGYFKDNWHSYNGLFYAMAAACLVQSTIWFVFPILEKVKQKTNEDKPTEQSVSAAHV
ncbi:monocarboxylate transporter 9-like isoform X2 [Ornithodoros turicata]